MDSSNERPGMKPEQGKTNDHEQTDHAADLLNGLKSELFDQELAEKYQKAQDVAQQMFAVYTELQRAGFTKQEAFAMVIAMCGGK